jgi:hypothetical protein
MKTLEMSFSEEVEPALQKELEDLIQQSLNLDEVIEYWCVERGRSLSLGVALDENYNAIHDLIEITFKHPETKTECACVDIARSNVVHGVAAPVLFDSFIIKERKATRNFVDLNQEGFDSWLVGLGLEHSEALYGRVGPKSAILPVVVAFVLSKRGTICISPAHCRWFEEEDMAEELAREGLDMRKYLSFAAAYVGQRHGGMVGRLCFDMLYCCREPEVIGQKSLSERRLVA